MTEKQRRKAIKYIAKNFMSRKSTYVNGLLMFSYEFMESGYRLKASDTAILIIDEKFRIPVIVLFDNIKELSTPGGRTITFEERR